MSESKAKNDQRAELEALLGTDPAEVVIPAVLPDPTADPEVVAAVRQAADIGAQLSAAEAERDALAALIPADQKQNPDAARLLIRAEKLLGVEDAAERLDRLNRFVAVRESLPVLRTAADLAAKRVEEAREAARRKLFATAKELADAAVVAASRAYLRAVTQMVRVGDLYIRLGARGLDSGLHHNPFVGQIAAHPHAGLVELLARLSHQHGLKFADVEAEAGELFRAGYIGVGHRPYFAA